MSSEGSQAADLIAADVAQRLAQRPLGDLLEEYRAVTASPTRDGSTHCPTWATLDPAERHAGQVGLAVFFGLLRSSAASTQFGTPAAELLRHNDVAAALSALLEIPASVGTDYDVSFHDSNILAVSEHTYVLACRGRQTTVGDVVGELIVKGAIVDANVGTTVERLAREADHPSPLMLRSQRFGLLMRRAPGMSLAEWLRTEGWLLEASAADVGVATSLGDRVLTVHGVASALLRALRETERPHGNLDPSSVLVTQMDATFAVTLLDPGEDAFPPDASSDRRFFRAPELSEGENPSDRGTDASDLFSFGRLLLQMLCPVPLGESALAPAVAHVWESLPGFARIIVDLTETNPALRNTFWTSDPRLRARFEQDVWLYIQALLDEERELHLLLQPYGEPEGVLGGGEEFSTREAVKAQFAVARRRPLVVTAANWEPSDLLKWLNVVAYVMAFICGFGAVYLTAADIGLWEVPPFLLKAADFRVGALSSNLPGRFIAETYAIVALAYYMKILATLTVRRLGLPMAELSIRIVPVLYSAPAVWVIWIDPQAWPAAATIGVAATTWTNRELRRIDLQALRALGDFFGRSGTAMQAAERQRAEYGSWWVTSLMYLVLMLVLDALFSTDKLSDKWFYAVAIGAGLNLYVIWYNSIRKIGGRVRGSIGESIDVLRRAVRSGYEIPSGAVGLSGGPRSDVGAWFPALVAFAVAFGVAAAHEGSVGTLESGSPALWVALALGVIGTAAVTLGLRSARAARGVREALFTVAGGCLGWSLLVAVTPVIARFHLPAWQSTITVFVIGAVVMMVVPIAMNRIVTRGGSGRGNAPASRRATSHSDGSPNA